MQCGAVPNKLAFIRAIFNLDVLGINTFLP